MLAYIRKKWTAEQLVHMTARARGEEGMVPMRVNKPPTSQVVTPKRLEAHQATNLAACFHIVLATVNGNAPKERAAACEAAMSDGGVETRPEQSPDAPSPPLPLPRDDDAQSRHLRRVVGRSRG